MSVVLFPARVPIGTVKVGGVDVSVIASRDFLAALRQVENIVNAGTPDAADIPFSPTGSLSSNNVQDALAEVDSEKQPKDQTLTALAGVATAADKLIYATALDTFATTDLTAFARTILDDVDAAAVRSTIGAGTGSGDVVGPASSVNSNVVLFNGVTGKVVKDSGAAFSPTGIGLGNVTNDAQTKAVIVPNTVPSAGQVLVGNAGSTAYAAVSMSGDASLSSAGAITVSKIGGKTVSLAGDLTTSGAFASTFTMTGVTTVTFPTSGTLAVVSGALGTPTSVTLTNATGLPISSGVSGLGTGVATFLATPSSANLRSALTDETGTGAAVFADTPTLVTPVIGAATGTSLAVTGALTSSGGGIGYATGAGGTVAQATNKSTGVTLNKLCGTITMDAAALNTQTTVSFTLTNSFVAATDYVDVQHASVGTLGAYTFAVAPAAGSVVISVRNVHTASLSEAIVLRFIVQKAVTA